MNSHTVFCIALHPLFYCRFVFLLCLLWPYIVLFCHQISTDVKARVILIPFYMHKSINSVYFRTKSVQKLL